MRRAIIVTSSASPNQIKKFEGQKLLALQTAVGCFKNLSLKYEVFNGGESHRLKAVDATLDQPINPLNEEQLLDGAFNYLISRGYDEIVVLKNIHESLSLLVHAIASFNRFCDLQIEFIDDHEAIAYFSEGTYVLSKNNCKTFSILTLSEAIVSLDHVNRKIKSLTLKSGNSVVSGLSFLQRVAVLKVEKGSAILIRDLENYD